MKPITTLAALAATALVAACSYSAESNFLGWRSSVSYSTPGAYPPPPPPGYSPAPTSPPPGYSPTPTSPPPGPSSCWRNNRYVC